MSSVRLRPSHKSSAELRLDAARHFKKAGWVERLNQLLDIEQFCASFGVAIETVEDDEILFRADASGRVVILQPLLEYEEERNATIAASFAHYVFHTEQPLRPGHVGTRDGVPLQCREEAMLYAGWLLLMQRAYPDATRFYAEGEPILSRVFANVRTEGDLLVLSEELSIPVPLAEYFFRYEFAGPLLRSSADREPLAAFLGW
jgi:hypothetical protein